MTVDGAWIGDPENKPNDGWLAHSMLPLEQRTFINRKLDLILRMIYEEASITRVVKSRLKQRINNMKER